MVSTKTKRILSYAVPAAVVVALLIAAYALAGAAFSQFQQDVMSSVTQRNEAYIEEFTRHAADVLEERFRGAKESTEALTSDPRVREIVDGKDFATLLLSLETESQFDHVRYVDAQGITHTSSGDTQDVSFRDYYIEGMKGNSGVTYVLESVVNGDRQISFYAPVEVDGKVTGVIVTSYDESTLAKSITTYFYGEQASAGIITREGKMLVNADSEFMRGLYSQGLPEDVCDIIETSYVNEHDTDAIRNAYTNLQESSFDFNWEGTPNTGYIAPLESVGLSLYMIFPYQATQAMYQSSVDMGNNLKMSLYIILAAVFWIVVVISVLVIFQVRKSSRVLSERDAAKKASEAKTELLFNMSHDLLTPMNAIIGYTGLIRKHQGDSAKCADYLSKMDSSERSLLSIINNVLEMSRIEKGELQLEEKLHPAGNIVSGLSAIYGPLMQSKGITFTCTTDVKSAGVYVDSLKVREIIENLISNSYKCTEPGGHISLSLKEMPGNVEGESIFCTTVRDDGKGMSEEYLAHIYERFSREYTSTESKVQGTGLGMSIVKRLVDQMGGEVEVQSKLGEGTTVTVAIPHRVSDNPGEIDTIDLPVIEDETPGEAAESSIASEDKAIQPPATETDMQPQETARGDTADLRGKRLLLVEDNDLNAEIAMELLSEMGFLVERASDGVEGVKKMEQADPGHYHAILMDIQMPNMNGYEATRAIRELYDLTRAQVPIIALTANTLDEDRRNAAEAGMNGFVAKPIDIPELTKALTEVLA